MQLAEIKTDQRHPQEEIAEMGILNSGFNCVIQMPTGTGKTWLAEKNILETVKLGYRAIYLSPTRALADELVSRWRAKFPDINVGIFTGDFGSSKKPYPISFKNAQILLMTPEKLDVCTRNWRSHWNWFPEVDLLVVDELHLMGEKGRGARLEGTISRFRRLNPFSRVIGLSATLGNRTELAGWLDGVEYSSSWRPIQLNWKLLLYKKAPEKPQLAKSAVESCIENGGKSLVFVQSRRRAESLCQFLKDEGLSAAHHHAGLDFAERSRVEDSFRRKEIDVLVSTSTLEMGLNLPVRQVVLYDLQRFDGKDFVPLSTNSVWQRSGRAGRVGLDNSGEAVLLMPRWDNQAYKKYESGKFEPINSQLCDPRFLSEQIIAEVGSGFARTDSQLNFVLNLSFAKYQDVMPEIGTVIDLLKKCSLLEDAEVKRKYGKTKTELKATRLGRILMRHLLLPETILFFQKALDSEYDLTFFDLLLVLVSCLDCEPVIPVDFEELNELSDKLAPQPSSLLNSSLSEIVGLLQIEKRRLLLSVKMALILREWTKSGDITTVAESFQCYPFEVKRLIESATRLLGALVEICSPPADEKGEDASVEEITINEKVKALFSMISAGVDESAVTLIAIKGIGPKTVRKLCLVGISDIEDLAISDAEDICQIKGISKVRAEKWTELAKTTQKTRSAFAYRETGIHKEFENAEWPSAIEPYRLRRSLDLTVSGFEGGIYRVVGGLEPHLVKNIGKGFRCDCADAEKGHICKHVLAVRFARGDEEICRLMKIIKSEKLNEQVNLYSLWLS